MPTYYSPRERAEKHLDRLRQAGTTEEITAAAVALVVDHGQPLGPTARRAGMTAPQLRKAVFAHPKVAQQMRDAEQRGRERRDGAPGA